jgi:hypothetical protein
MIKRRTALGWMIAFGPLESLAKQPASDTVAARELDGTLRSLVRSKNASDFARREHDRFVARAKS